MRNLLLLCLILISTSFPAWAQSTAQPIQLGKLSTSGCPSGQNVCFLPYSATNPMPATVSGNVAAPLNITGSGPQLQFGGCNILSTAVTTLTPGVTVSWNGCSDGPNYQLTLGQNTTLNNPTTVTAGVTYMFKFTQAPSGGPYTLTLGSAFTFGNGVEPTISTTASAIDMMSCFSFDGTNLRCAYISSLAH